mmetsp:Transcript_34294/g.25377  ORF Transcript_34294/g.25377 Transcript_34294/m.25377 type:complete len:82 (-) Transcript_34294:1637-1882(-)
MSSMSASCVACPDNCDMCKSVDDMIMCGKCSVGYHFNLESMTCDLVDCNADGTFLVDDTIEPLCDYCAPGCAMCDSAETCY